MKGMGRSRRMAGLHLVPIALGIVLFLWFLGPVFAGVCNIGNVTGMAMSAVLVCFSVFYTRIVGWLHRLAVRRGGRALCVAVAILVVCIVMTAAAETILMVRAAVNRPPENTTAVVLGCSVKGTRPSTVLYERLSAAYHYLEMNPEAVCVLSGGQGEGEDISEAECMYRYLTGRGIAPERLFLEDASRNTQENLEFSMQVLMDHGVDGPITIITSEFHAYRASQVARQLGIESYSTPSGTFFLYLPTFYVRELYGILYYWIR